MVSTREILKSTRSANPLKNDSLQKKDEAGYKERFVAFVDILDFKTIVSQTTKINAGKDAKYKKETFADVKQSFQDCREDLLRIKKQIKQGYQKDGVNIEIGLIRFSDCLVFWTEDNPDQLAALIYTAIETINGFIQRGFLCRGGISFGETYIDEARQSDGEWEPPIIFGPAFIKAYLLEHKHAGDARVIFCNEASKKYEIFVNGKVVNRISKDILQRYISQANDGPYQLSLFADFKKKGNSSEEVSTLQDRAGAINKKMTAVLNEYREDPKVFRKIKNLIEEFNHALDDSDDSSVLKNFHIPLPCGEPT